jgi:hypothetical protein
MSKWIPTAPPLDSEIHCIFCGYNLRGLDPAGRCPECGRPIAASHRGDRLAHADPAWLRKLRFGASLKLWNIVLTILLGMIAGIVIVVMGLPIIITLLIGLAGALLGLWATYCITAQEPRTALTEDPVSLRKFIRLCAIMAFVGAIIHGLDDVIAMPSGFSGPGAISYFLISVIASLAGVVVIVVELVYFRRFALRAPDVALARSTRTLIWGLGITWGLTAVGGVVFAAVMASQAAAAAGPVAITPGGVSVTTTITAPMGTTTTGAPVPFAALGVGVCAVSVLASAFFIWYVVLLVRYRRLFASALSERSLTVAASNENT